jgi:SAM-dependent methyltransferase
MNDDRGPAGERPEYLGEPFSTAFQDASVAERYHLRGPYPDELFDFLDDLIAGERRVVLDIGCGTGDIARPMAERVERVDAVDFSAAMIARGRELPGGDNPTIRWVVARAEDAPLDPPYGLVVAGESLHWMDWDVVFPRFHQVLVPGGKLAIASRDERTTPWMADEKKLIARYSTNQQYVPYDIIAHFERHGLWTTDGHLTTQPVRRRQSIVDYIETLHSRSSLSRARMTIEAAAEFDRGVEAFLRPFADDGHVEYDVIGDVVWGTPLDPFDSNAPRNR